MKIYIIKWVKSREEKDENVVVTSSRKLADHLVIQFSGVFNYIVEEHDLIGTPMVEDN